jgi:hypothetical protein
MKKIIPLFLVGIFTWMEGVLPEISEVWAQMNSAQTTRPQVSPLIPPRPSSIPLQPIVPSRPSPVQLRPVIPVIPSSPPLQPVIPRNPSVTPLQPVIPVIPSSPPLQPVIPSGPSSVPLQPVIPQITQPVPGILINFEFLLSPIRQSLFQASIHSRNGNIRIADQQIRSALAELNLLQQQVPVVAPQVQQAQSNLSEALRFLDRNRLDEAIRSIRQADEILASILNQS